MRMAALRSVPTEQLVPRVFGRHLIAEMAMSHVLMHWNPTSEGVKGASFFRAYAVRALVEQTALSDDEESQSNRYEKTLTVRGKTTPGPYAGKSLENTVGRRFI